jgi:hypothetical protein
MSASAAGPAHEPPPVAPEDDTPEDDDPDLDESALSGHELIVRELGATVVEGVLERVRDGGPDTASRHTGHPVSWRIAPAPYRARFGSPHKGTLVRRLG